MDQKLNNKPGNNGYKQEKHEPFFEMHSFFMCFD